MTTTGAGVRRRLPALDGLRGVAVLLVLGFHLPYGRMPLADGPLPGGFLGVDLFFVLSGFLITSVLLGHRGLTVDGLRQFYERRIKRLLPALVVATAGCLAVAVLFQKGDEARATIASIPATLGYWSNVTAATSATPKTTILAHTWSLSLEFQFYVVWPILLLALRRRLTVVALLLLTVIGVQAVAVWRAVQSIDGASFHRLYFAPDTRFDGLLVGCALALFLAWRHRPFGPTARLASDLAGMVAAGLVVLLATQVPLETHWLYQRGGLTAVAILAAVVIHAAVVDDEGLCAATLRLAPFVALGRISYSLYLWHWPVIFATAPLEGDLSFAVLTAARIAASLVLATLSYLLVERVTHGRRREADPGATAPAQPAMAGVA